MVRSQHGWVGYKERRCRCSTCCAAYVAKMKERREKAAERRKAVRKRRRVPVLHGWDTMTKSQYDRERAEAATVRRAQLREKGI